VTKFFKSGSAALVRPPSWGSKGAIFADGNTGNKR